MTTTTKHSMVISTHVGRAGRMVEFTPPASPPDQPQGKPKVHIRERRFRGADHEAVPGAARMIIPKFVFFKKYQRKIKTAKVRKIMKTRYRGIKIPSTSKTRRRLGGGNNLPDRPKNRPHQIRNSHGKTEGQHQGIQRVFSIQGLDQIRFRDPPDQAHDDNRKSQPEPEVAEEGNGHKDGKSPSM